MKLLYFGLLIMLRIAPAMANADPIDNVALLIKQGNVNGLTKLFAENIEITLLNEDNVYSKTQAGLILDKFFSQNKPLSVKILHKVNSKTSYSFGVVILTTDKAMYRMAYTLKGADANMSIIELRIEMEKVK